MSAQTPVTAVVLAAGKGTRMKSATPKVLHPIAGRPMIHYPVRAALEAGAERVVIVVGHGREHVEAYLRQSFGDRVELVVQDQQKGTGHAVLVALAAIGKGRNGKETPPDARVLILSGDTPLLRVDDLRALLAAADADSKADMAMLTATLSDATGYGRILRRGGFVVAIKEHRDCSEEERSIHEINPAVYAVRHAFLAAQLPKLQPNNAQGELYLTDLIAAAAVAGGVVDRVAEAASLEGINDRAQLAQLDGRMLAAIIRKHQLAGVTVRDPASTEIHDSVTLGTEVVIERGVVLRGATTIGDGAVLDVGCVLTDVEVAAGAHLKPYSIASQSKIGPKAQIGPFSHLRPASDVGEDAHVGNFVELKKTRLGKGSKANHLAYLGDGEVGEGVNVGAGTIFCNYDGFKKHVTTLEDGAFIGSDSQLVAPVRVGKGAYVGTGTTVTRDVPAGALAIGRAKQENKEGYADKLKARLKAGKVTAYFALWRVMFLLALILELPIVVFASPREKRVRVTLGALVGNAITHPLLWFGWPRLLSGAPMLVAGETCAVVVEALAMELIGGIDRKRAFVISLAANFYSWGVGEIINRVVFPRMAEYLW